MNHKKLIGVVGGVGSYAGIDLIKKIYDNTVVNTDQDHFPVTMLSLPAQTLDRTEYLLGNIDENPGEVISEIICQLSGIGAQVAGIPCNTAHAPEIFNVIKSKIPKSMKLAHMIEEVALHLSHLQGIKRVGILSTTGTYVTRIYPSYLAEFGMEAIHPSEQLQNDLVHPAVYDPEYGIKAKSSPIDERARRDLLTAANYLFDQDVDAIVLGCTEIPMAIHEKEINGIPIVDATEVLARALIRESLA